MEADAFWREMRAINRSAAWGDRAVLNATFGLRGAFPVQRREQEEPMPKQSPDGVQGEGDYRAAKRYRHETEDFIAKRGKDIPDLAKKAEKAVEGPEGRKLAAAERKGKSKARH